MHFFLLHIPLLLKHFFYYLVLYQLNLQEKPIVECFHPNFLTFHRAFGPLHEHLQ